MMQVHGSTISYCQDAFVISMGIKPTAKKMHVTTRASYPIWLAATYPACFPPSEQPPWAPFSALVKVYAWHQVQRDLRANQRFVHFYIGVQGLLALLAAGCGAQM